ncbi:peptidase S8/S53 domain-containing protein [Lactarius quietus]|nr:peptidase S8/S53 domain-containing protein [Lactarius quietus]
MLDYVRVKHTWHTPRSPSSNATIDLHIALLPQYENALINALYEVSTPRHPKYGAHLSKVEVAKLVAPHRYTFDLVNSWLKHRGIPGSSISVSHGGGWLTVAAVPVSQANEMLNASYQLYRQSGTNDTSILRTISYALPAELHKHVQTVVPTTYFGSTDTQWQSSQRRSVNATADMASRELGKILSSRVNPVKPITPMDLRWLYRTSTYVPVSTDKNAIGVVVQINGGEYNPSLPTVEASQSIQYAEAMVYPTPVIFYSVGGGKVVTPDTNLPGRGDAMLEWLNNVLVHPEVPKTLSISYGKHEKDLPLEYATALCDMYAKLGALGVSVLFASGNGGVGRGDCKADDGVQFVPEFPASCPYITSVGGTTGGTLGGMGQGFGSPQEPEVAAFLSGGGFSNYFPRPPYQKDVVPDFLKQLGSRYAGMYKYPDGRGIPDISAQALDFIFIKLNLPFLVGGTSSATPIVAGIISLLNDYLLSTDRPPLGFLNPLLYDHLRPAMNDITSGSNPGCNTPGFSAVPGWDPVTGLGTPDFLNLQALRDLMDIY